MNIGATEWGIVTCMYGTIPQHVANLELLNQPLHFFILTVVHQRANTLKVLVNQHTHDISTEHVRPHFATHPPASVFECRHRKTGKGRLVAVEPRASEYRQPPQQPPPDFSGERLPAMRVEHPALVQEHALEGVALEEGQSYPQAQHLKTKHHRDNMVAVDTNPPERKRGQGSTTTQGIWWEVEGGYGTQLGPSFKMLHNIIND